MDTITSTAWTLILIICLCACKNDGTAKITNITGSDAMTSVVDKVTSSERAASVLLDLIQRFDTKLCEGTKDRSVDECYEFHAVSMKDDLFQNRSYEASFPYNGAFTIDQDSSMQALSFMTKNCGFQKQESKDIVNYYCFMSESKLMDFLIDIQGGSPLIAAFCKEYQEQKIISPDIRRGMVMESNEHLDFKNPGHRLFYMLFHILTNEEKLASKRI